MNSIDISQWTLSGEGNQGECYVSRYDSALILKLFYSGTDPESVLDELSRAEMAEYAGIPCPGPGTFVRSGDRCGVIYRRIENKKSFCRAVADNPACLPEMASRLADMARTLHAMPSSGTGFGSVVEEYWRLYCRTPFDHEFTDAFRKAFESVSASGRHTIVHGDFHFGNAVTDGTKDYFIDLGSVGYGDPDIDNSMLFGICHMIPDERVFKDYHITKRQAEDFWNEYRTAYYGPGAPPDEELAERFRPYLLLRTLRVQADCGRSPMNDALMRGLAGI